MPDMFSPIRMEMALFKGNPLREGEELVYESYGRVPVGEVTLALYGVGWGVVNKNEIRFITPKEDWEDVTHIAFLVEDTDAVIMCAPLVNFHQFFDSSVSMLDAEPKTIPEGKDISFGPHSLFLIGGIIVQAMDPDNCSRMVN